MRFTILAFAPIPDIETARRNLDLHDLADADVARILFQQHLQRGGADGALSWDQLQIAGVSMIHHSVDYFELRSHGHDTLTEAQMIGTVFDAVDLSGRLITWQGRAFEQPLLHFRCMKHRIAHVPYWRALEEGQEVFADLSALLDNSALAALDLERLSRRLFFPGMLGVTVKDVWDAWLAKDFQRISAYTELRALNTYLLTLEVLGMRGQISYADVARVHRGLRDYLAGAVGAAPHLQDFLEAWMEQ